ncbi:TIGR03757 family integrating conjugative element protein [Klebsiella pneumoniae]|nr:TIGR03757 family integrating conjugative element protein [Klebsiella pneumoniae]
MQRLLIIIASLVLAGQACADVVLYTDRHHPPLDNDPQVTVVWLDAPDTALEPDKAERQAKVLPQSPNWARQQARIVDAWQGVLKAWQLDIRKVPAVVFDDRDVVYGTTDIQRAAALRAGSRP